MKKKVKCAESKGFQALQVTPIEPNQARINSSNIFMKENLINSKTCQKKYDLDTHHKNLEPQQSSFKMRQSESISSKNTKDLSSDINQVIDNLTLDFEEIKEIPVGESIDLRNIDYLKENDYIFDGSIKIEKFISEGAQAKIYLGLIEEINKQVAIKRYTLPTFEKETIEKVTIENNILNKLENDFIVKYFDVDYTTEGDGEVIFLSQA